MQDILNLLNIAGRRLSLNVYLDRLHRVALYVTSLAILVAFLIKGFPVVASTIDWSWVAPLLTAVALFVAFMMWVRHRPTSLHIAIAVDDRLGLREKISTALLCRNRDDAFTQAAVEDAISVARNPKVVEGVGRVFPVKLHKRWWVSPALAAVAVLMTIFVPNGDLLARAEKISPENSAKIKTYQNQVEAAIIKVAEKTGTNPEELKKLLNKKTEDPDAGDQDKPQTPEEAQKEAFKDLKKLQDVIKQQTENEKAQALAELQRRLSELDVSKQDNPASDLGQALKQGNFTKAKKALKKLQKQLKNDKLDAKQKKKLAEQLKKMAKQMDKLAKQNKALADALKKAGIDPQAANNPQAMQKAIENAENLTPEQKKKLQKMAQAMQQAGQMMQQMSNSMKKMGQQASGMPGGMKPGGMGKGLGNQLSQMEMLEQQMSSMQATMDELAGQCNKLGKGMGLGNGQGLSQSDALSQWQMMMQQRGGGQGPGMGNHGRGRGGRASRLATRGQTTPDRVNVKSLQGPIIGEMLIEADGQIKGESRVKFSEIVKSATNRSRQELDENKIGVQYQDAVKHFFGELDGMAETSNVKVAPAKTDDKPGNQSGDTSSNDK